MKNLFYKLGVVKVIAVIILQLFLFTNINIKDGFSFSKEQIFAKTERGQNIAVKTMVPEVVKVVLGNGQNGESKEEVKNKNDQSKGDVVIKIKEINENVQNKEEVVKEINENVQNKEEGVKEINENGQNKEEEVVKEIKEINENSQEKVVSKTEKWKKLKITAKITAVGIAFISAVIGIIGIYSILSVVLHSFIPLIVGTSIVLSSLILINIVIFISIGIVTFLIIKAKNENKKQIIKENKNEQEEPKQEKLSLSVEEENLKKEAEENLKKEAEEKKIKEEAEKLEAEKLEAEKLKKEEEEKKRKEEEEKKRKEEEIKKIKSEIIGKIETKLETEKETMINNIKNKLKETEKNIIKNNRKLKNNEQLKLVYEKINKFNNTSKIFKKKTRKQLKQEIIEIMEDNENNEKFEQFKELILLIKTIKNLEIHKNNILNNKTLNDKKKRVKDIEKQIKQNKEKIVFNTFEKNENLVKIEEIKKENKEIEEQNEKLNIDKTNIEAETKKLKESLKTELEKDQELIDCKKELDNLSVNETEFLNFEIIKKLEEIKAEIKADIILKEIKKDIEIEIEAEIKKDDLIEIINKKIKSNEEEIEKAEKEIKSFETDIENLQKKLKANGLSNNNKDSMEIDKKSIKDNKGALENSVKNIKDINKKLNEILKENENQCLTDMLSDFEKLYPNKKEETKLDTIKLGGMDFEEVIPNNATGIVAQSRLQLEQTINKKNKQVEATAIALNNGTTDSIKIFVDQIQIQGVDDKEKNAKKQSIENVLRLFEQEEIAQSNKNQKLAINILTEGGFLAIKNMGKLFKIIINEPWLRVLQDNTKGNAEDKKVFLEFLATQTETVMDLKINQVNEMTNYLFKILDQNGKYDFIKATKDANGLKKFLLEFIKKMKEEIGKENASTTLTIKVGEVELIMPKKEAFEVIQAINAAA